MHSGDQLPASYDDSNVTRIEDVVTWPRHMRALRSYSLMPGLRRRKQCFHSRNRRGAVRGTESGPSVCVWPVLLQSSHSSHAEKVGRWPEHSRRLCRGHDIVRNAIILRTLPAIFLDIVGAGRTYWHSLFCFTRLSRSIRSFFVSIEQTPVIAQFDSTCFSVTQ